MENTPYSNSFFDTHDSGVNQSAKILIPILNEICSPSSVVDVGCGRGNFLHFFIKNNVIDVLGVDGDYIDLSTLYIPEENFIAYDLNKVFKINRKFDLVMSLEVAEHLPEESVENFIDTLTSLGSVIIFSAAIPGQNGINHVNEQWPEYWAKKFYGRGYIPIDCIRKKIWSNNEIFWWYRQNILIYIKENEIQNYPKIYKELEDNPILSIVHPELYMTKINDNN